MISAERKKGIINETMTLESVRLGVVLAIVGGFLDVYTYICRGGVFANAQTGNLVLIGLGVYHKNPVKTVLAAAPVIAFVIGVFVVEYIKSRSKNDSTKQAECGILYLEILVLFFVGFIPLTAPNTIATIAVSFASSVQIASFRRLVDSPYSTAMCTGNLRTATEAVFNAITKKDKKSAVKALRYGIIITSFLFGGFLGALFSDLYSAKAVWVPSLLLVVAVMMFKYEKHKFKDEYDE